MMLIAFLGTLALGALGLASIAVAAYGERRGTPLGRRARLNRQAAAAIRRRRRRAGA